MRGGVGVGAGLAASGGEACERPPAGRVGVLLSSARIIFSSVHRVARRPRPPSVDRLLRECFSTNSCPATHTRLWLSFRVRVAFTRARAPRACAASRGSGDDERAGSAAARRLGRRLRGAKRARRTDATRGVRSGRRRCSGHPDPLVARAGRRGGGVREGDSRAHASRHARRVRRQRWRRAARRAARVLPRASRVRGDGPRVVARGAAESHRLRRPMRVGRVRRRRRGETRARVVRRRDRCVRITGVAGRAARRRRRRRRRRAALPRRAPRDVRPEPLVVVVVVVARALRRVHQRKLRFRRQGNRRARGRGDVLLRRQDRGRARAADVEGVPGVEHHVRHLPERRVRRGGTRRVRRGGQSGPLPGGLRGGAATRGGDARVLHADAVRAGEVTARVGGRAEFAAGVAGGGEDVGGDARAMGRGPAR